MLYVEPAVIADIGMKRMKLTEVIAFIEKIAPPEIAPEWDPCGVQVATMHDEVHLVAVMLDPTLDNLARAAEANADFILAHHPLSMKPHFPNKNDSYLASLSLLLTKGIFLYSAHSSLDASPYGPVRWLAKELHLKNVRTLNPFPSVQRAIQGSTAAQPPADAYGFGFTGHLDEKMPYAEFCRTLGAALGKDKWLVCGPQPEMVSHVACCPGSGRALLPQAIAAGVDVYITGDIRYHAGLEARQANLRVLDVGHFILEEKMMSLFARQMNDELDLPVLFFPGLDPFDREDAYL